MKFIFFIICIFFIFSISAYSELPPALLKIQEYNLHLAESYMLQITFFAAFLAGILGILSPCILPFLPAYFAYSFKEKTNITLMTFIFFCGFALVFVIMGIVAGFFGEQTFLALQGSLLPRIAGVFLIVMGIMIYFGRGFSSFFSFHTRFSHDVLGVFLFGCTFALGWSACLGPFLSGILAIGALLHNVYYAALLLFFYALGNFVPLFILSFFYDSFSQRLHTFNRQFLIFGREVALTSLLSSILFVLFGLMLILFSGTAIVNSFDIFGTKQYFFSLQRELLGATYTSYVGAVVLVIFSCLLIYFLRKKQRN